LNYNGYSVGDPEARVALFFVGEDSEATAYWMGAINDPAVPAEERKDLIEDLNQDGLSNPRDLTMVDLPLIEKRIELIEEVAPMAWTKSMVTLLQKRIKIWLDCSRPAGAGESRLSLIVRSRGWLRFSGAVFTIVDQQHRRFRFCGSPQRAYHCNCIARGRYRDFTSPSIC